MSEEWTDIDPHWSSRLGARLVTAEAAIAHIRPGQRVFIATGCAAPQALVRALARQGGRLADVEVVHLFTLGKAPYAAKALAESFSVNTFFVAGNVRAAIRQGRGAYTPLFLSEISALFASGQMPLDVALIQVSPPDLNGRVSLGISLDVVKSAVQNATLVIAQVNPSMPRTRGEGFLELRDIDLLVARQAPLVESPVQPPIPEMARIGPQVAALVGHGSTIEAGIGRVPQGVLPYLAEKRDLGIHTEMFSDELMALVDSGAVTGRRKSLDKGLIVASFCLGSRKLYRFVQERAEVVFKESGYVNDPRVIAAHHRMVAINTALEVDLTGQVCADSLGSRIYSGVGGLVDFAIGASRAPQGRSIIALAATAKGGKVSRIVAQLQPGAGASLTRGGVHYVVTEFGTAYLHGKSIPERAMALISIAHPRFRGRLLKNAIKARYLWPEMSQVEGMSIVVGPQEARSDLLLRDGTRLALRPAHPTDQRAMKDMFYQLSHTSIYRRFMSHLKRFPFQRIKNFLFIDHRREVVMVATLPESHGERIVAMGGYHLDAASNRAEVAFMVADSFQGRGIGRFLFKTLAAIARGHGIAGFVAETLLENRPMQEVILGCGYQVHRRVEEDLVRFEIDFTGR